MKILISIITFSLSVIFSGNSLLAQDIINTTTGKTINCDITKITVDTLFFKLELNNIVSNTFIVNKQVSKYNIGEIEELRTNMDTVSIFFIKLDDGTGLTGRIRSIFESQLLFEDHNFGIITIKGETIEMITKENKNAFFHITLLDGNEIHGQVLERRKDELDIQTKTLGKVTISLKSIKKMREVQQGTVNSGKYWFTNPNNTRYFFSPTAIPLKKGEGYYQNIYVVSNSVNYGISDNFSIGGGVILPVVAFISPKFGFKITEKFHLGGGAIIGLLPGPTTIGILYGVSTYGTNEHNVTIGAGYGFIDKDFIEYPIITFSAMTRVSRRVALVTENWGIPYRNYEYVNGQEVEKLKYISFISYGLRIMKEKITFDIALVNNKYIFDVFPIGVPYIDFVYKF